MRYHIVGIAGAGMSAIASLLLDQGHTVSGSDLAANSITAALVARGAVLHVGHSAAHVAGADAVLATAAVRPDHSELVAARAAGIPVLGRADLWRTWSRERAVVAVAGTHGKTTTSAMIAVALRGAGVPCGYLVGSSVPDLGGNAAWGDPAAPLVIEADEYDRVFLALSPAVAVITNVEWDHPDIYPSADDYSSAFRQFAAQARALVVCGDDPGVEALGLGAATFYGIEEALASDPVSCRLAPLDWTASGVTPTPAGGVHFDLWRYNRRRMAQQRVGSQELRLPGAHNVRNALAALAACEALGAELALAAAALAGFGGTARRFELKGEASGVTVIDDYAHHPTEVRATLAAARGRYPGRRIVAYLQPHTFSRTTALLDDWATACGDADLLLVGDVYPAREQGDAPGLARTLAGHIAASGVEARAVGDVAAATAALAALARSGDVVLTLGAGDGDRVGLGLLEHLVGRGGSNAQPGHLHASAAREWDAGADVPPISVCEQEPMDRHTSWRAGGAARYYAEPATLDEARALAAWAQARGLAVVWAGRGTNMLVRDEGFPGLIAAYRAQGWTLDEAGDTALLRVEAGAAMAGMARRLSAMGWAGLEWAEGLPGTVGGAVFGNAGCYGGDTAGILVAAELLVDDTIETWPVARLAPGYRTSALKVGVGRLEHPPLVLAATFRLTRGDPAELAARTAAIAAERKRKTPSGSSCGSVFKNPPGDSAGRLIEAAGLKGRRVGAAVISPIHANYIVNTGGATAADILALIETARLAVRERFGVELELEVRLI